MKKSAFSRLSAQIPQQQAWAAWLREVLPVDLAAHVVNVVPKPTGVAPAGLELIVLADSAAWCARLRYALAALAPQIMARDAAIQQTRVKVSLG